MNWSRIKAFLSLPRGDYRFHVVVLSLAMVTVAIAWWLTAAALDECRGVGSAHAAEASLWGSRNVPATMAPPAEYQFNASVYVQFTSWDRMLDTCTEALGPVRGGTHAECVVPTSNGLMGIARNPCTANGEYAAQLCHMLGHLNGWPANHPRGERS